MFYLLFICCPCFALKYLKRLSKRIHVAGTGTNTYLEFILNMCKLCSIKRKEFQATNLNNKHLKLINYNDMRQMKINEEYCNSNMNDHLNSATNGISLKNDDIYNSVELEGENNYLETSNKIIKPVLNVETTCEEGNQNIGCLKNITSIYNINQVESSLNVLYSNYSEINFESAAENHLETTTDGEYLENIIELNEVSFENADIETVINDSFICELNLSTSSVFKQQRLAAMAMEENDDDDRQLIQNHMEYENLVSVVEPEENSMNEDSQSQTSIENVQINTDDSFTDIETIHNSSVTQVETTSIIINIETTPKVQQQQQQLQQPQQPQQVQQPQKINLIIPKQFKCETCEKQFENARNLNLHIKKVHLKNFSDDFKCSICDKINSCRSQLTRHMATHSTDRPFQCTICNKSFKSESNRRTHMLHHQDLKFSCPICNKKFVSMGSLKDHSRTHAERKFECTICGKAFALNSYLRKHQKTHDENGKKFKCETCSKQFTQKSHLIEHSLICTVQDIQFTKS